MKKTRLVKPKAKLRVGLVVPHIFMHQDILPRVIFSPAVLALELARQLDVLGAEVTLYTPGPVDTAVRNVTADLSGFEAELAVRGDDYMDLLRKHPLTFVTLARQAQAELVTRAYADANAGLLDVVHVYTNEEEIALVAADLCTKPVVFSHHDPFNFLVRYRALMPKYADRNWLSMSLAQRAGMPEGTHWVGNINHGLDEAGWPVPETSPAGRKSSERPYVLFLGRIIEPKGVHLAIGAVREYNRQHPGRPLRLVIAGKHYGEPGKDRYWRERIEPEIDGQFIEYAGFVPELRAKQALLAGARALLMPSVWNEPFGMVAIEALASGTPVIGVASGALPEIIDDPRIGRLVPVGASDTQMISGLSEVLSMLPTFDSLHCRQKFEERFTSKRMARQHLEVYETLLT